MAGQNAVFRVVAAQRSVVPEVSGFCLYYHAYLMTEAASTSKTSVNFYQSTWRYNPEDSHLQTHRRENLNSHSDGRDVVI
jgi:hypothetical protein